MRQLLNDFLDWFDNTKLWRWFAENIVGHFTFRWFGYPKFPMEDYFKIAKLGQPGDFFVFCSIDRESLAAKLIKWVVPGKTNFSHAGIVYYGNSIEDVRVIHMRGQGILEQNLLYLLREIDGFYVGEIPLIDGGKEVVRERIEWLFEHKDKIEYDYQQTTDDDDLSKMRRKSSFEPMKIYCSELIRKVFSGQSESEFVLKDVAGRKIYDPDSVLKDSKQLYTNVKELNSSE